MMLGCRADFVELKHVFWEIMNLAKVNPFVIHRQTNSLFPFPSLLLWDGRMATFVCVHVACDIVGVVEGITNKNYIHHKDPHSSC
jgi:hypothetical protein